MRIGTRRDFCTAHVSAKARDMIAFRRWFTSSLLPEVLLQALHPLEVGDDDAARVREHVRQDEHAVRVEDRRRRASSARSRPPSRCGANAVGVLLGDHLLERARREHVAVEHEQLVVRDRVAASAPRSRPPARLWAIAAAHRPPAASKSPAGRVRDRDHGRAELGDELREVGADVAEALHHHAQPLDRPVALQRLSAGRRRSRARSPPRGRASRRSPAACR